MKLFCKASGGFLSFWKLIPVKLMVSCIVLLDIRKFGTLQCSKNIYRVWELVRFMEGFPKNMGRSTAYIEYMYGLYDFENNYRIIDEYWWRKIHTKIKTEESTNIFQSWIRIISRSQKTPVILLNCQKYLSKVYNRLISKTLRFCFQKFYFYFFFHTVVLHVVVLHILATVSLRIYQLKVTLIHELLIFLNDAWCPTLIFGVDSKVIVEFSTIIFISSAKKITVSFLVVMQIQWNPKY